MAIPAEPVEDLSERVSRWVAGGERYEVEFKGEQRERLSDRELVEAVVCLANGRGGVLLVGVEDDGAVSGARPRHEAGRTDPLRVQALIANATQPPVSVIVQTVAVQSRRFWRGVAWRRQRQVDRATVRRVPAGGQWQTHGVPAGGGEQVEL